MSANANNCFLFSTRCVYSLSIYIYIPRRTITIAPAAMNKRHLYSP